MALVLPGAGVEEKKIVHAPVRRALNAMRKETETLEEVRAVFDACRAHLDSFCDALSLRTTLSDTRIRDRRLPGEAAVMG